MNKPVQTPGNHFRHPVHNDAAPIDQLAAELHATRYLLARHIIEDALTPGDRRKLHSEDGVALIIAVPSDEWIAPIRIACLSVCGWSLILCGPEAGYEDSLIADRLSSGGRVLGIAQSPDLVLPRTLVAAADVRIVLRRPSPALIRRAIRSVTGLVPGRIPKQIAKGLTFDDMAAALRQGSAPATCIRRMKAAAHVRAGTCRSRDTGMPWQDADELRADLLLSLTRLRQMLDKHEYDEMAGEVIIALGSSVGTQR